MSDTRVRTKMTVDQIMRDYRPGSHEGDWTWADEQRDLWERDYEQMSELRDAFMLSWVPGMRDEPITLGDDGRVWDGHHRILAALQVYPKFELPVVVVDE